MTITTTVQHFVRPTPAGEFACLWRDADATPVVLASGWGEPATLAAQIGRPDPGRPADAAALVAAVEAWSDGDAGPAAVVGFEQHSGPTVTAAWAALREVAAGTTVSYTELAARAGHPLAVRAAASACARNAAALFVPCHRVLRADGSLGGFRWGTQTKRRALDHEGRGAAR